jgi:hypothetical protein
MCGSLFTKKIVVNDSNWDVALRNWINGSMDPDASLSSRATLYVFFLNKRISKN